MSALLGPVKGSDTSSKAPAALGVSGPTFAAARPSRPMGRFLSTEVSAETSSSSGSFAVYLAFLVFGLGSWATINAIFVESSFLVSLLPESWSLTTWIVLALQAGNLFVLCTLPPLLRYLKPSLNVVAAILLLLAVTSAALLAGGGYDLCAWILGAERSLGLLLLTFVAGIACCGSSLVFYPLAASFPRRYTTALAIGEGLSGSLAGVLGILQNHTRHDGGLAFSPNICFALIAVLCVVALGALSFLTWHPLAEEERKRGVAGSNPAPADMPSSDSNSDSGSSPSAPGESVLEASSVDVIGLASSGGGDASGFHGHFWHFRGSFLVIFLGSGLSFGVLPSLNPIACLSYSNGQDLLLWCNVLIYGFDPLSRLATAFVSCKKLGLLTVTFTLAAALVVWEAFIRQQVAGHVGWVPALANLVFAATFGYARTMAFLMLKDSSADAALVTKLYWAAGCSVQAGSFCGSVAALLLVEVFKVFG